jgi:N-terminal domain of toast_rack, DUF2154
MRTALVAAATLVLGGCSFNVENTGPVEHFQKSIDLDKSTMARVELKMGAGELRVDGGSSKLMDADFEYNIPSWRPIVRYEASSFRGELLIEQPGSSHGGHDSKYKWNLRLNDKVPFDVVTHLGAGEAHLNMGSLNLRSVEVHMGVGEVELDLRGKPTRDYNVQIHGGIGQAVVHLPASVGIVANAAGGIGNIDVRGLEKRGGHWINAAHENSPVTIHLDVKGGIGNITLTAE